MVYFRPHRPRSKFNLFRNINKKMLVFCFAYLTNALKIIKFSVFIPNYTIWKSGRCFVVASNDFPAKRNIWFNNILIKIWPSVILWWQVVAVWSPGATCRGEDSHVSPLALYLLLWQVFRRVNGNSGGGHDKTRLSAQRQGGNHR